MIDRVIASVRRTVGREWMGAVCACLAVLLYVNTLQHGYALDDFPTIYGNRLTMSGVKGIPILLHTGYWYGFDGMNDWLYRPLSLVMFAVEWEMAPNSPAVGHWINVLLYATTAVVLLRFLRSLFDGAHAVIPFAITLLWIAHPLHTEVVANIKSRDEVLAFLFAILTLRESVRYVKVRRPTHLLLVGLFFFLALMSKESPITLVVIVPMTLFVFTRADARSIARVLVPIAIGAGVYLAIRGSVLTSQTGSGAISLIDNSLIAAPDFLHREATAFRIAGTYIRMLFIPHPMSSDYSYPQIPIVGFGDPYAAGALVLYVALGLFSVWRTVKRDAIGYGILFYLVSIALVANVVFLTRSTMADRFLYAPSLGFCIVLVLLLARLPTRLFVGIVAAILIVFAALTLQRNPDWKNDTTLFAADSRHAPNSARVHFLYGNHMLQELKQGNVPPNRQQAYYSIALTEFRRAIQLYPSYAEPHMGIGDTYAFGQDIPAATKWFEEMVARNPRFAPGYMSLSGLYASQGDSVHAREYRMKAQALNAGR